MLRFKISTTVPMRADKYSTISFDNSDIIFSHNELPVSINIFFVKSMRRWASASMHSTRLHWSHQQVRIPVVARATRERWPSCVCKNATKWSQDSVCIEPPGGTSGNLIAWPPEVCGNVIWEPIILLLMEQLPTPEALFTRTDTEITLGPAYNE